MFGVVPGQRIYSTYVGEGGGGSETVGELGGWGGPGSLITQPQRLPLILSPFFLAYSVKLCMGVSLIGFSILPAHQNYLGNL